nr:hypothetical protein [Ralstonia sp. ASV6]
MAIRMVSMLPRDGKSLKALSAGVSSDPTPFLDRELAARDSHGVIKPLWLRQLLGRKAAEHRARLAEQAYREASGGRVSSPRRSLSLDEVNAALSDAADDSFLASRSEAAFCQAGVVAPPDSLTDETLSLIHI